jgi:hypothetical protein
VEKQTARDQQAKELRERRLKELEAKAAFFDELSDDSMEEMSLPAPP